MRWAPRARVLKAQPILNHFSSTKDRSCLQLEATPPCSSGESCQLFHLPFMHQLQQHCLWARTCPQLLGYWHVAALLWDLILVC